MPKSKVRKDKPKEPENIFRVYIKGDTDKGQVSFRTVPKLGSTTQKQLQTLLNVLIAGTDTGLKQLLKDIPLLRPATDVEREASVYVFKNEELDTKLYKNRKTIYDSISHAFNETLNQIFPDVVYIDHSRQIQQEMAFEMDKEEHEEHLENIKKITDVVRNMRDEDEKTKKAN